jgi:PadR family transcriptional regulator PadR
MQKPALQGAVDLMILKILSRRPKLHGYAIMTLIQETSEGVLRAEEGSLYPALRRLEQAGLLSAEWILRDGRRARIYTLTTQGRKQLNTEESRWQAGTSAVNLVLRMA